MHKTHNPHKKMKIISILALALVLVASGCATQSSDSQSQAPKRQPEKNPEVGMTKEQVIQMYGKTSNLNVTSDGESWIYIMDMGEAFIPFNFGYRPKMRIINFGRDGLVKSWSYSK